ncbi:MAG: SCO family protein [Anaerolineae bacterium]|nr:SCO family protein [Anaerolineae bacterium]
MPNPNPDRAPFLPIMLAALFVLLLAGLSGCATVESLVAGPTLTPIPPGGDPVDPPRELPDFTLTGADGTDISLSDLAGKPALVYFGYTHCPDVCPLTLAEMRQVATLLGERADEIQLVFISVDGQRDTPQRLREFLPLFGEQFIGMTTTDKDRLERATDAFDVYYELEDVPETQAEYLVAHTASTFLVDASGRLTMIFAYRTPPALIADEFMALLEPAPTEN